MTMRTTLASLALLALPVLAQAQQLTCAEDRSTFKNMCFANNGVRSNDKVRAALVYQGGPKSIRATTYTARVHCVSRVLELTDREGVAFARNVPEAQLGKDFVRYLCEHHPTKNDPKLATN